MFHNTYFIPLKKNLCFHAKLPDLPLTFISLLNFTNAKLFKSI